MTVANGDTANQSTFNSSFMSREGDTSTTGKVDLSNADSASGTAIVNIQREHNSIASFVGKALNGIKNLLPTWVSNTLGSATDTLKDRIEAHDAAMDNTAGHTHDGTQGGGGPVSATIITDINLFFVAIHKTTFDSAGGTSDDVSASFSGKVAGGTASAAGVVTTSTPNNVEIRKKLSGAQIVDAAGQKVYARLTESAGTWTLTYYTNESGVETAHSLATQDISIFYREVYAQDTRPTFDEDQLNSGSFDPGADIVDAAGSQRGLMGVGTQTFNGAKTWAGSALFDGAFEAHLTTDASSAGASVTLTLPTKTGIRFTGALTSITMIGPGSEGRVLYLINRTGGTFDLINETGASASSRIITGTGSDLAVDPDASVILYYDSTSSRWQVVGGSAVGSSSGLIPETIVTAKGDLIAATGNAAVDNLPIGTNGFILTADSGEATGMKWAANTGVVTSRNFIDNAQFRWSQRNSTLANCANGEGNLDRWYMLGTTGNDLSNGRFTESPSGFGTLYSGRFTTTASQRFGTVQFIESLDSACLRGKQVTLTFAARTDSTEITTIRAGIVEWTGTQDNPTRNIVSSWGATPTLIANAAFINTPGDLTISSTYTQFSITVTLGASLANLAVFIWTPNAEASGDDFYLKEVQLVKGSAAPTFDITEISAQQDLARCQRFYQKTYDVDIAPGTVTDAGSIRFICPRAGTLDYHTNVFRVEMFKTPVIQHFSPATGTVAKVRDQSAAADVTAVQTREGTSGFTTEFLGVDQNAMYWHWTAAAQIGT